MIGKYKGETKLRKGKWEVTFTVDSEPFFEKGDKVILSPSP